MDMKTLQWDSQDSSPVMNGKNTSKILSILELENSIYNMCWFYKIPGRVKQKKLSPPYGLTFASFTTNVGVVEVKEKWRKIDAGHVNAYLIIPGIVYHLSATLEKGNIHEHVGREKEMQLIQFLCRFGYATRKGQMMMLHVAYMHYCHGINETQFLQGCLGYYRIIPVTLFLTKLFNACMTYQEDKTTNLLISALNCFDIGATVQDEIFMNTLGTITIFCVNFKTRISCKFNPLLY